MTWIDLRTPQSSPPAGRFAPTPTGALHVGNAYSALLAVVSARAQGLRCHLRVDDLDRQRVRAHNHEAAQLEDLVWLGLSFDPLSSSDTSSSDARSPRSNIPIYRQSERYHLYERALLALNERGLLYPCYCTRREVIAAAPHATDEGYIYPGTCRPAQPAPLNLPQVRATARRGLLPALRLNVHALPKQLRSASSYTDLIAGSVRLNPISDLGDFVVQRRDGVYGYQLACAIDDHVSGCVVIARGADLIISAHRQRLILSALGVTPDRLPRYAHAGLVVDERGARLAKRDQSISLRGLREAGVDPAQLRASLSRALGGPERSEIEQMAQSFQWSQVSRDPVRWSLSSP